MRLTLFIPFHADITPCASFFELIRMFTLTLLADADTLADFSPIYIDDIIFAADYVIYFDIAIAADAFIRLPFRIVILYFHCRID